jgi:hypothetical protein
MHGSGVVAGSAFAVCTVVVPFVAAWLGWPLGTHGVLLDVGVRAVGVGPVDR